MWRIDERTVVLDDAEVEATEQFDHLLDVGYGIEDAIDQLRPRYEELSEEFWAWLR